MAAANAEGGIHQQNGTKLRMKKYTNGLSHESSKLKMAGAASLQRDRVLVGIPDRENNNNSDLGYARK